jgi:hypothetical protein
LRNNTEGDAHGQVGATPLTVPILASHNTEGDAHGQGEALSVQPCTGSPLQTWGFTAESDGTITVANNGSCVDNNFYVPPGGFNPHVQHNHNEAELLFPLGH